MIFTGALMMARRAVAVNADRHVERSGEA